MINLLNRGKHKCCPISRWFKKGRAPSSQSGHLNQAEEGREEEESKSAARITCSRKTQINERKQQGGSYLNFFLSPLQNIAAGAPWLCTSSWWGLVTTQLPANHWPCLQLSAMQWSRPIAPWTTRVSRLKEKHMVKNVKILRSCEKQCTLIPINVLRKPWESWWLSWNPALDCIISQGRGVCWETIRKDKKRTQLTTKLSDEDECAYQWSVMNLWCALEEQRTHT